MMNAASVVTISNEISTEVAAEIMTKQKELNRDPQRVAPDRSRRARYFSRTISSKSALRLDAKHSPRELVTVDGRFVVKLL